MHAAKLDLGTRAALMYVRSNLMRIPVRLGLAGLVLLVAVLTVLVARLDPSITPNLATGATVTASSTGAPNTNPARLLDGDIWHIGHQTNNEDHPWVELDFHKLTRVSRVVVYNRVDCCWADAAPLVLELAGADHRFKRVARADGAFEKWTAEIAPQDALYLRVELMQTGALVLDEIEVL